MPRATGAAMGRRGLLRPISCRKCNHKCSSPNGLRVRKIRRPQMACTRRYGACATHGTLDPNLLSEPRKGLVQRGTCRPRQEPAAGRLLRCPRHRARTCASSTQPPVFPGTIYGKIAAFPGLPRSGTPTVRHEPSMDSSALRTMFWPTCSPPRVHVGSSDMGSAA